MGHTDDTHRTFVLKLNLYCKKCAKDVREIVLKIEGVVSIDIDKDLELGKATISGNVNPETVIKKLKESANKDAKLLGKEEESPPKINHQEMQNVLQQNPVRIDQQKVTPQPPGNVNALRGTKKLKDKGKHGKEEEEERPTKKKQQEVKNVQHNPEQRKVTPQPSDKGKHGKEEERPTKKKQQEVKNVQHNPDQRKVTPQPSDKGKHGREEEEERPTKKKQQEVKKVQHNPDQRKVTPQPSELKDKGKHGKEEEEEKPTKKKQQEVKNVQHNPDQRKMTPQPSVLSSKSIGKRMEGASHDCNPKHELELKSYNKPFKCDKCKEDGFTSGYRCKHRIFDLHKVCLNPKPEITHDLFPKSTFKIVHKPVGRKNCDACGKEIHGHFYSCEENNLDLHPACSQLPGKLRISGTDFVLCENVKYECFWCKKKKPRWFAKTEVAGLCYVSERDKFSCHVGCLPLVMEEAWKRVGRDSDRNNDSISKALEKVDWKLVADAKGSGGLFLGAATKFLKAIIGILFGDPTGLIVSGVTELVKVFLTL